MIATGLPRKIIENGLLSFSLLGLSWEVGDGVRAAAS
jgi:hypothetical protein